MAAHTKGPWFVYEQDNSDSLSIQTDDERICFMATPGSSPNAMPRISANANLIAAAPELLECLKDARRLLPDQDAIDLEYVDSVIAKAEGAVA